jgi:hypothetical protein
MTTVINEIMWKRRMMIEEIMGECKDTDLKWRLNILEDVWLLLYTARETKDRKYVDQALKKIEFYAGSGLRDDVRATLSGLAKLMRSYNDLNYLERTARREYYDLLEKCLSEKLPF